MRALRNTIYIGSLDDPDFLLENDQIIDISTSQEAALVGQEMSIDVMSFTVSDKLSNLLDPMLFRSSDGETISLIDGQTYAIDVPDEVEISGLIQLPYGTKVWFYQEDALIGKFYVDSVKRVGSNKYRVSCVSAIGILDKLYNGGGLFTETTFGAVLQQILAAGLHGTGSAVIDYAIDDDVADISLSGWLPYASKRNNLYQLIFSCGVNIVKNIDGNPRFTFVYGNTAAAEEIDSDDIFIDGNVEYTPSYSKVSVMEHTYTPMTSADPVILYDNSGASSAANSIEIWFDEAPVIVSTLTTDGTLTVESATENSAVISGIGQLTGVPYTHTTREVSRQNVGADTDKTVQVEDCTLVNDLNSENLLNRLFAFYCPAGNIIKIKNDIIYSAQRCGKQYKFLNPYKEESTAFLSKMEIKASSFDRATCEYYAGYSPAGQAGLFQHCIILDAATYEEDGGVFTVPAEVFESGSPQIRVVMIGGGTGGGSGWPGENGEDITPETGVSASTTMDNTQWYGGLGGAGGAGGAGGDPGRVLNVIIHNPDVTYNYTIGTGGEGGAATGFIPDTADELQAAFPDEELTQEQIDAYLAEEATRTDWSGTPNAGTAGTASTFQGTSEGATLYSTDDEEAFVPTGGVYNPIFGEFYALPGGSGMNGGAGGARKVGDEENFSWATDGESVTYGGVTYEGGKTGQPVSTITGLPECNFVAYGGNGAGAAVGLGRDVNAHMDGGSDASGSWEVTEDGV